MRCWFAETGAPITCAARAESCVLMSAATAADAGGVAARFALPASCAYGTKCCTGGVTASVRGRVLRASARCGRECINRSAASGLTTRWGMARVQSQVLRRADSTARPRSGFSSSNPARGPRGHGRCILTRFVHGHRPDDSITHALPMQALDELRVAPRHAASRPCTPANRHPCTALHHAWPTFG